MEGDGSGSVSASSVSSVGLEATKERKYSSLSVQEGKAGGQWMSAVKYLCDFGHIYCVSTHSHLGKKMSGLMRVLVLILVREFPDDLQIGCC